MIKRLLWALFLGSGALKGTLSHQEIEHIGRKIWQNEASGKKELLVFWNQNEPFPSLGIGHNIWLPAGSSVNLDQKFPLLCAYLKKNKVVLPIWLEKALPKGAPWPNREAFYKDTRKLLDLRKLLVDTIELQAKFMIEQLRINLKNIILCAPPKERSKIEKNVDLLLNLPMGTYALVDYLNFKGSGCNVHESAKGEGWGLLGVLMGMPAGLTKDNVVKSFAISAIKKLVQRIENSGPDYKLIVFLQGWINRINTYWGHI